MPGGRNKEGTPGRRKRVARLLKVVRAEVGPLLPAERLLVRAAALGEFCEIHGYFYDTPFDSHDDEERWRTWGQHRVVRAAVLRTLCVRKAAQKLVDPLGVRLAGARITGVLRLDGANVPYDIIIHRCGFEEPIDAFGARLSRLNLPASRVPGLRADGLETRSSVFLRHGFHASGQVRLVGAKLGDNLDCEGGHFQCLNGAAIAADRLQTSGGVFLRHGFRASGEVRLLGARIHGDLDCESGWLEHTRRAALDASGAEIAGSLFLRSVTIAGGLVLARTRISMLNDRAGCWPEQLHINDFRYDAIHTQSPLDAASRLAWLANHDRSMQYLPPSGWPGMISRVRRVVLGLLPEARAGYWSKDAKPCDPQPYRQLAGVLRRQGHEGDANAVLTALGWRRLMPLFRERWRESWWGKLKALVLGFFAVLYGAIVGHGYARFRPLYWILAFWALGSAVFWIDGGRVMQPTQAVPLRAWTKAEARGFAGTPMQPVELAAWARAHGGRITGEDVAWANAYPRFNPVVYALDALLPLVDFHQEEYWTPRNGPGWVRPWPAQRIRLAWWLRLRVPSPQWWIKAVYLPLHIAMGWIVATLFAASFTRLARRD